MKEKEELTEDLPEKHPRYGMISIHRSNCNPATPLVGSNILHNRFISLDIYSASYQRVLNQDNWFQDEKLCTVFLTETQLGELLSGINTSGVPCTLDFLRDYNKTFRECYIDQHIPFVDKVKQHKREFNEEFRDKIKYMNELVDKLGEDKVGKKATRELLHSLKSAITNLDKNYIFAFDQFQEYVDKSLSEAKNELNCLMSKYLKDVNNGQLSLGLDVPSVQLIESKEE